MKRTLWNSIRWFGFYLLFFVTARIEFFLINGIGQPEITWLSLVKACYHGLIMDLSMAGYVTLLNLILYLFLIIFKSDRFRKFINGFNVCLSVVLVIFLAINARLFEYWGYHIDESVLKYLVTPKEALASANPMDWVFVILLSSVMTVLVLWIYPKFATLKTEVLKTPIWHSLWLLVIMGALVIPIRGGVGVATVSLSSVYFSSQNLENQIAINPVWNAAFSLTEQHNVFKVSTTEIADSVQAELSSQNMVFENSLELAPNTNVILIVLESFTANVISSIGGFDSITPNLNKWMSQGISFTNCYSSGDRSDKGLTTLFTGFPSLPNDRLLSFPRKLQEAPNLYRNFNSRGYNSSFYYGGNLDFAGIGSLFTVGGVDKVVTEDDFDSKLNSGKWGVRDEIMFDQFQKDLSTQKQPFFSTLYTLSSHEPFDIPPVSFSSNHRSEIFFKAVYYTDSCFGVFMENLKESTLWDNTIVIITADHGVKNPGNLVSCSPRKFRIPLLFTGGVIDSIKSYDHYVSHTDIGFSIEEIVLGKNNPEYLFSKSVFDTTQSYVHYYYQVGAGMVNEHGCIVYDVSGERYIVNRIKNDSVFRRMSRQLLGISQKASNVFQSY